MDGFRVSQEIGNKTMLHEKVFGGKFLQKREKKEAGARQVEQHKPGQV